ncbi:MAG: hypothetical protein NZ528_17290 [Caldilineales bacterium]|nr:hypothetical protein [Caldilineales bacterium]MDW8316512.1 hypothetical protein [Anaerolineae bacterium]
MARLHTTVEPLTLLKGSRQAQPWNFRVVEPTPNSPQAVAKGNLYVLLELGGAEPASPRLYRLLLNTVQGVYYDAAGGITGGLTEAIMAVHRALEGHNALHPAEDQRGGISCVVLRGEELYMAVGGPAMVVVGHPDRVEQFPAELSTAITPLGGSELPVVEVYRTGVSGRSMVVQLQSEWAALIPTRKLASVGLAPDVGAALDYLESLAPADARLSALAIQVEARPADTARPEEAAARAPEATGVAEEAAEEAGPTAAAPSPEPVAVGEAKAPEPAAGKRRRFPWFLLLLVPLLIVAVAAGAYWWQQRTLQLQVASLVQGAEAALAAATAEGVPEDTARQQLQKAQEQLDEALRLQPTNQQAQDLQAPILEAMNRLNRVVPLYKLITLREFGAGNDPGRLEVRGSRVFVLDRGQDQVLRYGLDEVSGLIPEAGTGLVAQRGQALADGQVVGELIDMAWAPAGGARSSSNLLVLDSNNNVLQVEDVLGLRPLAVAARESWQSPRLISSYIGNLYVLDSATGRIWRYLPTADGYSNPPQSYFEGDATLDLSQAVDMAIDGNIWILYSDGTVQTFFQGRQQPLVLETPPNGPIVKPQALYVGDEAGAAQSLYILDSGGARVVEYSKSGKYLRQLVPADAADREKLRQARDLQVDEVEGVLFILTAPGLLQADLPRANQD